MILVNCCLIIDKVPILGVREKLALADAAQFQSWNWAVAIDIYGKILSSFQ